MKLRAKLLLPTTLVAALLVVMAAAWAFARARLKRWKVPGRPAAGFAHEESVRPVKSTEGDARQSTDGGTRQMKTMVAVMQAIRAVGQDLPERPGDPSAGLAAIVDDVRLLSQRCAVAAKETARKIDASVSRSEQGVEIGAYVAESFAAIQERILELESVVAKIATPSPGRYDCTGHVNTVVVQKDLVTQSNAGSVEESANAAEKLCALSEVLNNLVASLQQLAGARRGRGVSAGVKATPGHAPRKPPASMHRLSRPVRPEAADPHTLSAHRREVPAHRPGRGINGREKFSRS